MSQEPIVHPAMNLCRTNPHTSWRHNNEPFDIVFSWIKGKKCFKISLWITFDCKLSQIDATDGVIRPPKSDEL